MRRPYTPPERIAGGDWDRRADVFSLAALTHELLWARRVSGTGSRAVENLTRDSGRRSRRAARRLRACARRGSVGRFETALEFADALAARSRRVAGVVASPRQWSTRQSQHDSDADRHRDRSRRRRRRRSSGEVRPPADVSRPAVRPDDRSRSVDANGGRRPTPQLPLLDRQADVDLPISEIARAENDRYRDVEMAPAIVPQPTTSASRRSRTRRRRLSRYLDYVRDEPAGSTCGTGACRSRAPIVVRPTPPEPTLTPEPQPSVAGAAGARACRRPDARFGAGYGVGLRAGVQPRAGIRRQRRRRAGRTEFTESRGARGADSRRPPAGEPPAPRRQHRRARDAGTSSPRQPLLRAPPPRTGRPPARALDARGRASCSSTGSEYGADAGRRSRPGASAGIACASCATATSPKSGGS